MAPPPATPGVGNPTATFPAQQRPPGDPAMIARGNGLYGANCRLCHGADLRGGDQGGPNLLRSAVVLADQSGRTDWSGDPEWTQQSRPSPHAEIYTSRR